MTLHARNSSCAVHTGCGRGTEIMWVAIDAIRVITRSPYLRHSSKDRQELFYPRGGRGMGRVAVHRARLGEEARRCAAAGASGCGGCNQPRDLARNVKVE